MDQLCQKKHLSSTNVFVFSSSKYFFSENIFQIKKYCLQTRNGNAMRNKTLIIFTIFNNSLLLIKPVLMFSHSVKNATVDLHNDTNYQTPNKSVYLLFQINRFRRNQTTFAIYM